MNCTKYISSVKISAHHNLNLGTNKVLLKHARMWSAGVTSMVPAGLFSQ